MCHGTHSFRGEMTVVGGGWLARALYIRRGTKVPRYVLSRHAAHYPPANPSGRFYVILRVPTYREAHVQSRAQEGQHRDARAVAGRVPAAARLRDRQVDRGAIGRPPE